MARKKAADAKRSKLKQSRQARTRDQQRALPHNNEQSPTGLRSNTDMDARDAHLSEASGFARPLSFQGKGYYSGNEAPFERGTAQIGPGHAIGYGPGVHSAGLGFRGIGPKGYRRSDDRITEEINDRLTYDDDIDATEITVSVDKGEVTLSGTVKSRSEKRRAEDIAQDLVGVTHLQNNLRVKA